MTSNTCIFRNLTDMATFCAGLTREGIAFDVTYSGDVYHVVITGY